MRFISAVTLVLVLAGCAEQPLPGTRSALSPRQQDSNASTVRNEEVATSDESAIAGRDGVSGAWGFTFGTNQATVAAHARLNGDEVAHHGETLTVINRFDKRSLAWSTFILEFCNDRLYVITKPLTGVASTSTSGFIDTLYGFVKERGNPTILLKDEPLPDGNHSQAIEYRWGTASSLTSLIFSAPVHPTGNVVPGMLVERKDAAQCSVR